MMKHNILVINNFNKLIIVSLNGFVGVFDVSTYVIFFQKTAQGWCTRGAQGVLPAQACARPLRRHLAQPCADLAQACADLAHGLRSLRTSCAKLAHHVLICII